MEKVRPWCGQPSDRGPLIELNRTSSREERRRSGCAEGSTSTTRPDAHEIFSLYEEEAISFDKAI